MGPLAAHLSFAPTQFFAPTSVLDFAGSVITYPFRVVKNLVQPNCAHDVCQERMRLAEEQMINSEFDETGASFLAQTAEKRAIHEAFLHARRAVDAAKDAADGALQAVEEISRIQKFLDPHDIIQIQNATEADAKNQISAEIVGLGKA